jgi:hypothetical protein
MITGSIPGHAAVLGGPLPPVWHPCSSRAPHVTPRRHAASSRAKPAPGVAIVAAIRSNAIRRWSMATRAGSAASRRGRHAPRASHAAQAPVTSSSMAAPALRAVGAPARRTGHVVAASIAPAVIAMVAATAPPPARPLPSAASAIARAAPAYRRSAGDAPVMSIVGPATWATTARMPASMEPAGFEAAVRCWSAEPGWRLPAMVTSRMPMAVS